MNLRIVGVLLFAPTLCLACSSRRLPPGTPPPEYEPPVVTPWPPASATPAPSAPEAPLPAPSVEQAPVPSSAEGGAAAQPDAAF